MQNHRKMYNSTINSKFLKYAIIAHFTMMIIVKCTKSIISAHFTIRIRNSPKFFSRILVLQNYTNSYKTFLLIKCTKRSCGIINSENISSGMSFLESPTESHSKNSTSERQNLHSTITHNSSSPKPRHRVHHQLNYPKTDNSQNHTTFLIFSNVHC